ncbi:MAG: acyl-CoA thioesterase [Brumimicrobium sp.]
MKRNSTRYKRIEHLTTIYEGRVKFNEVDSLGIVWHGHYISFFEEGREYFGRKHGLSYLDIKANNYTAPIVNVHCDYKASLKFGDTFTVKTFILDCPSSKLILEYEIYNPTGELMCEGRTVQVFLDKNGNLALYSPDFFTKWKNKVNFFSDSR